jgi:hypothetical protein
MPSPVIFCPRRSIGLSPSHRIVGTSHVACMESLAAKPNGKSTSRTACERHFPLCTAPDRLQLLSHRAISVALASRHFHCRFVVAVGCERPTLERVSQRTVDQTYQLPVPIQNRSQRLNIWHPYRKPIMKARITSHQKTCSVQPSAMGFGSNLECHVPGQKLR